MSKKISEAVRDPGWQSMRRMLRGKWNLHPEACLGAMRMHLGDCTDPDDPRFLRVYNYMTCSGFRSGAINMTPTIARFIKKLRAIRAKRGRVQR